MEKSFKGEGKKCYQEVSYHSVLKFKTGKRKYRMCQLFAVEDWSTSILLCRVNVVYSLNATIPEVGKVRSICTDQAMNGTNLSKKEWQVTNGLKITDILEKCSETSEYLLLDPILGKHSPKTYISS
jgi:hypothetical protein